MNNRHFQLLFVGVEGEGYEMALRKTAIIERFRLNDDKAHLLFSGEPVVVKRNLDAETAIRYKLIVDRLGGITRIEAMPRRIHPHEGRADRRKLSRRFLNDRRSRLRIRAIDTNRRSNKGRRAADYERAS